MSARTRCQAIRHWPVIGPAFKIAMIGVITTVLFRSDTQAEDWRQFGGPTGDFHVAADSSVDDSPIQPTRLWQRTLGPGLAGVAVADDTLIVCHLDPKTPQREVVSAIDKNNGDVLWSVRYEVDRLEGQEAFGGRKRSPQATPLVIGKTVVTLGFTGWLHALDLDSGDVLWKMNLVDRFQAVPVQFGFSASPIEVDGRLVVLAGGQRGGLVCMDPADGRVLWQRGIQEASYATPIIMTCHGSQQIVFVTRNRIVAVDSDSGDQRWSYALPKPGLTNVPTPIVTSDDSLIVSGQGIGGTCKLSVLKTDAGWRVEEAWFSQFQFFYCNWLQHEGRVIGCNGELLVAFDVATGRRLGRWRGFQDANLCQYGSRLIAIHGNGLLSTLRMGGDAIEVASQHRIWKARVWTPPTIVDGWLIGRSEDSLRMIDLLGRASGERLPSERIARSRLAMVTSGTEPELDPMDQIVAAFERDGTQAALKLYQQLRSAKKLTVEDQRDLVELAINQGLNNEARQLAADARDDHPGDTDVLGHIRAMIIELDRKPASTIQRGSNGLDYVEFAVRNDSGQTLQTYVKGPEAHPFSYGIPFPPGKVRLEKWPIGTKLYLDPDKPRGEVLLEVVKSYAGTTINVKPKS